jgi:hypothetical protein
MNEPPLKIRTTTSERPKGPRPEQQQLEQSPEVHAKSPTRSRTMSMYSNHSIDASY